MIKLTLKFLCISALLFSFIAIAGCGGGSQPVDNKAPNTAKNETPKTEAPKTEAPKTEAPAGEKVGVAECDEYLDKLEACITGGTVPEASRSMIKSSLDTNRKQWKDLAANPQTKPSLTTACKTALDTAKKSYTYCKW